MGRQPLHMDPNVWHNEQPFIEENDDFIDEIVNDLVDEAIQYSLDQMNESEAVQTINGCIDFIAKYPKQNEEIKQNDEAEIKEDEAFVIARHELFDHIDLGGSESIIPAPIAMDVE